MADQVLTDLQDGVLTITLNQSEKFNALSSAMLTALNDAVRRADHDAAVRTVVLTGAGRGFCSGADISEFNVGDTPMDLGAGLRTGFNPLVLRMRTMEKPVLAAVNGVAAGAGLSLALACDLRYAAESARFVVAFIKIGLVPDAGLMYFLPRLIGTARTLELAWTGDSVSASQALQLGLVNSVVPDSDVLDVTQSLAARLAHSPLKTVALIKRGINQSHELPLERVLEMEANYQSIASRDPNFIEGVAAFKAKRPPEFNRFLG